MSRKSAPPELTVSKSELGENENDFITLELRPSKASNQVYSPHWRSVKKTAQRKFVGAVERIVSLSRRDSSASNIQRLLGLSNQRELPVVSLGPIIGKVTETSARILLEINKTGVVFMELEAQEPEVADSSSRQSNSKNASTLKGDTTGPRPPLEAQNTMEAGRPKIFVFNNLEPGKRYRIKLDGALLVRESSFRTFPAEVPESINYAVISCNKIFITEKEIPMHSDLWSHLSHAIEQRKIDMCLHLGDQIYGDGDKMLDEAAGQGPDDWSDCFRKSKAQLEHIHRDEWKQKYETICESYRQVYRKTWSHPSTAYCLANCPNLMIYDDHEVRDNWADVPSDWDSRGVDFFVARCAWTVNLEYQRQLHEDVDFDKLDHIDKDYHLHLISGVGIMFLDIRGSRTFHRVENDERPYLGSRQWQDVKKAMAVGGLFHSARVLLLCTPAPLVFLKNNVTTVVANNVPRLADFKGHWSAAPHFAEQKQMIDCLCEWKEGAGNREVLVLGGDVHCGGHSEVFKNNEVVFRQLTTSAIANHPLPKSAYYSLRAVGNFRGAGSNFDFRHHDWTRSRNYGMVYIKGLGPESNTKPEVTSQLIKGKFMVGFQDGIKVNNVQKAASFPVCCVCVQP